MTRRTYAYDADGKRGITYWTCFIFDGAGPRLQAWRQRLGRQVFYGALGIQSVIDAAMIENRDAPDLDALFFEIEAPWREELSCA